MMMRLSVLTVTVLLLLGCSAQDDEECFCVEQIPLTEGKTSPTVLTNAGDGSDRLFYGEQNGKVWVWEKDEAGDWQQLPEPFVDLSDFILVGGEQGFLSLSFHPDHVDNGLAYMYYSYASDQEARLTLLTEVSVDNNNPNKVNITTERELLRIVQPYTNHNGGDIFWAEDYEGSDPANRGNLYIALGDGGAAGDPFNNALNKQSLLGKMLRINPLAGEPYGIPEDNPFVDDPDYLPEIYAIGLRNPWRISVDKPTGNTFIGDVGQNRVEEIDIMYPDANSNPRRGINFGWAAYEGTDCYKSALCPDYEYDELEWPIFEYTHEDGRKSVTGGFVYRGCKNPGIVGDYFAADYMQGLMFRLSDNGDGSWRSRRVSTCSDCSERNPAWSSTFFQYVQTFGIDEQGEVYFASNEGEMPSQAGYVYRIIDPDTYQDQC